jgi:hypothetical protein
MNLSHLEEVLKTEISIVEAEACRLKEWLDSVDQFENQMQSSAELEVNSQLQKRIDQVPLHQDLFESENVNPS